MPFIQTISKQPKTAMMSVLLLTLVMAAFIVKIKIDTDPENMLSADQVDRVFHNQVKETFQLHDMMVVGVVNQSGIFNPVSLKKIETLANEIAAIDGVVSHDLMALSHVDNVNQNEAGQLQFQWLMRQAPVDQTGADWVAEQVARLPLLQNTLVSEDQKATAIYVPIKNKDKSHRISVAIQTIIDRLQSELGSHQDAFHITGLPVAEDTFGYQMFVQMGISAPLAALMICVLMFLYFRNLKFIAAPMAVAMATCLIIMGLMIGMGYTVHIMSSMIPIFLMPIAVVDSVHIMSDFTENYTPGKDKKTVIIDVMGHLFKPMLFTSVTSSVGFFSLMLTPIPPVQIFGAFVGLGVFLAFVLTLVFVPAYLVLLKPESLANLQQTGKGSFRLKKMGTWALRKRFLLVWGSIAMLLISAWGISRIQINDNPVRWFESDHPIRVADRVLNAHFAGTYDAYLVLKHEDPQVAESVSQQVNKLNHPEIKTQWQATSQLPPLVQWQTVMSWAEEASFEAENDAPYLALIDLLDQTISEAKYFQSPEALAYIEGLQQSLLDSGLVGKSNGLPEVVKTVYRELQSGQESDYRLPSTAAGVAQTLLQFQSSHRPHDLWHFVNQSMTETVVWLQLTSGDNQDMAAVMRVVDDHIKAHPLAEGVTLNWAGKTYLNGVWQQEMVAGMMMSLLSAFVVVFIMMVLLFRSVLWGFLAMLPLSITIAFIYGLIGWLGKDYDMPIAVLSSLTLGLSVDFAIHFLQRAKDLYQQHKDFGLTMRMMFEEPATAISRNAVVIAIGFTPLLLAPLVPYVTVGFFLASIMAVSALVTLLLLPAALMFIKKWVFK